MVVNVLRGLRRHNTVPAVPTTESRRIAPSQATLRPCAHHLTGHARKTGSQSPKHGAEPERGRRRLHVPPLHRVRDTSYARPVVGGAPARTQEVPDVP